MLNNDLFEAFSKSLNLNKSTVKSYRSAIYKYESFHQLQMEDLINEALIEEEKKIPLKKRSIKKRLSDFRTYILDSSLSISTVRTYISRIKTFYRYYGVELPYTLPIKSKGEYIPSYNDLPSKNDIKRACDISSMAFKAVILFISSSGCAKAETLSLTVKDFIKATEDYHDGGSINDVLMTLNNNRNIIPSFYIKRIKTNKFYYAFCSSEASFHIVKYLLTREELSWDDKLFDFSDNSLIYNFKKVNDSLDMGFVGKYRFFRSHSLRKFHASNIGLTHETIDELQGRAKTKVHEAYIKPNPAKLKEIYINAMENVMVFDEWIEENRRLKYPIENKPVIIQKQEINIIINFSLDGMDYKVEK